MRIFKSMLPLSIAPAFVLGCSLMSAGCGGGPSDGQMVQHSPEVQQKEIERITADYKNYHKEQAKQNRKGR